MIDASIEAQFAGDKATFLKAAGDSNREAPFDFGDLPDYRPDGTRSGRNNDSLPRLWLTDFEKTDKGSHPRHTEDAKRVETGAAVGSSLRNPVPFEIAYSCQPP